MTTAHKTSFIDFLLKHNALKFGEFVLKSGRIAPYFINTSVFDSGSSIMELGKFYAAHIESIGLHKGAVIFGPAYKGIPLAVATSVALAAEHGIECGYCFNRKEAKDHGDRGEMVGRKISAGDRVVIVEDVITAGSTLKEIVPVLKSSYSAQIDGVIVSVDRRERGTGKLAAVDEVAQALGIKVYPIVTVHEIIQYLSSAGSKAGGFTPEIQKKAKEYLDEYGA